MFIVRRIVLIDQRNTPMREVRTRVDEKSQRSQVENIAWTLLRSIMQF
jgi:hypothetical protein